MLSIDANEIIARAQQNDLQREETRLQQERDARKMLRLQAGNNDLTTSELLRRLAGSDDEAKTSPDLTVPKEKRHEPKPATTGFPPPPKQAGSAG